MSVRNLSSSAKRSLAGLARRELGLSTRAFPYSRAQGGFKARLPFKILILISAPGLADEKTRGIDNSRINDCSDTAWTQTGFDLQYRFNNRRSGNNLAYLSRRILWNVAVQRVFDR
jgi:hypothetical protein